MIAVWPRRPVGRNGERWIRGPLHGIPIPVKHNLPAYHARENTAVIELFLDDWLPG
ncbi:hypothetical protein BO70DRAFT_176125 [Aspergillus heteromorphus CBS 117.55]|uniref:Uncharacterized protein n=1 Tax=Aspergillus heteromorphus CBS 117.55 TaxID=1448321 RepID=A0A317UXM3_9EURO|nr:uncharacterized protein BO70DRAFT_176125 [Aspergillus heteromorphus CBS 117.55]PWY66031.1 hypothetical protein BO70DRAFT_176125 [Aspergillus heteromorphus CBS 117.55]